MQHLMQPSIILSKRLVFHARLLCHLSVNCPCQVQGATTSWAIENDTSICKAAVNGSAFLSNSIESNVKQIFEYASLYSLISSNVSNLGQVGKSFL